MRDDRWTMVFWEDVSERALQMWEWKEAFEWVLCGVFPFMLHFAGRAFLALRVVHSRGAGWLHAQNECAIAVIAIKVVL